MLIFNNLLNVFCIAEQLFIVQQKPEVGRREFFCIAKTDCKKPNHPLKHARDTRNIRTVKAGKLAASNTTKNERQPVDSLGNLSKLH